MNFGFGSLQLDQTYPRHLCFYSKMRCRDGRFILVFLWKKVSLTMYFINIIHMKYPESIQLPDVGSVLMRSDIHKYMNLLPKKKDYLQ